MPSTGTRMATPLLWTGGWDSTFRLLSLLLREQREVQPYYILDSLHFRPAVPAEREAMRWAVVLHLGGLIQRGRHRGLSSVFACKAG